jgi:hypothetical protein
MFKVYAKMVGVLGGCGALLVQIERHDRDLGNQGGAGSLRDGAGVDVGRRPPPRGVRDVMSPQRQGQGQGPRQVQRQRQLQAQRQRQGSCLVIASRTGPGAGRLPQS